MQSTFKFPLGMAILDLVDKGKLKLDQKIHVSREELQVRTWSPLREKFPEGNIDVSLAELLGYTVSQSDNITCDILFKLAGGPAAVDKYVHRLGVKDIAIVADEAKMATDWNIQFTNWSQPHAMLQLLEILHHGKKLSKSSNGFLLKLMTETVTGPKQIKGLLPKETVVAHKTGSSSTNAKGLTAAMNDLGIINLPNGKHLVIVVFITNSMDSKDVRDDQIARIAKIFYDYFSNR
jgi:beta-lactamase class A